MVWADCLDWLEPALNRFPGAPDTLDLFLSVLEGTRQLWIAWDEDRQEIAAAAITELVRYDGSPQNVCRVPWVGGRNIDKWGRSLLSLLKEWSVDHGCRFMEGSGRRGWKKFGFAERGLTQQGLPMLVLDLAEG